MDRTWLNISRIEAFFSDTLSKGMTSVDIYAGNLPSSIVDTTDRVILIDCSSPIEDYGGYGKGIVNIFLYRRNYLNGQKDVAKMNELEEDFYAVMNNAQHPHYYITKSSSYSDYDGSIGFSCTIVSYIVKIV